MMIDVEAQSSAGAGKEADAPEHRDPRPGDAGAALTALRNIRMMHFLERIAARFNQAGVPLMVLKGAALNLTLHRRPDERPMADLDLLIRPQDLDQALTLLEQLGALRGEALVREDFFPRYHYEMEYSAGRIHPVKIDLHVRPFRPLRYARLVPNDALWKRAREVRLGRATVLVPGPEDMLIHLCAHVAVHGFSRSRWLDDIVRWARAWQGELDWDRFIDTAVAWGLVLPVRQALERAAGESGSCFTTRTGETRVPPPTGETPVPHLVVKQLLSRVCPEDVLRRLRAKRVGWRDRLALRQAPRDGRHPVAHLLVDALCTPGFRFVLGYLKAVAFPDRVHMADWYGRRHRGWLPLAHALRFVWPAVRCIRPLWTRFRKIETRESGIHGIGVFATRDIEAGEFIARYHGRPVEHHGPYVGCCPTHDGQTQRYEITGPMRFLNHSCHPNAELRGFELVALRPIAAGKEVTIDYTNGTCSCRQGVRTAAKTSPGEKVKVADAA